MPEHTIDSIGADIEWIKQALTVMSNAEVQNDKDCRERHTCIDKDMTEIKVRSGFIALIVASVQGAIAIVIMYFIQKAGAK